MKRVAVCISGQLRTFEKIWYENKKLLEQNKNFQIDYFCYFWKRNGNTWRTLPGHNRTIKNLYIDPYIYYPKKIDESVNSDSICKILPNSKISICASDEADMLHKDGLFDIIENFPGEKSMAFASFCLWKSIHECDQLRVQREKSEKFSYDAVMRIRPDWKLKTNPIKNFFDQGRSIIFYDSSVATKIKHGFQKVSDVCFIARSNEMSNLTSLYTNLLEEVKNNGWRKYDFASKSHQNCLIGESALFWHVDRKKISINKRPNENYGFIYRTNYDGLFEKKLFSFYLLFQQITEMPKKMYFDLKRIINQL
jgi:hypothetical protein